jgi:hypothetical protein
MRRTSFVGIAAFIGLLVAYAPIQAQPQVLPMPHPRLLIVTPPGGKAGATVEVTLTGQELDSPQSLIFSTPGIKAELANTSAAPPADPKKPAPKQPMQAPTGTAKFKVSIPADARPGIHDMRVVTPLGISNPRAFVVGDLDEVLEKEPNNDVPEAQRIALNSTVNGTISSSTDVDYFVFAGKKGQRVVVSCLTSSIDSRLFAGLELYSKQGSPLGANREYQDKDAVLDATLPSDSDYFVRVFAFTYTQGSPEHFYRLTISTAPWIDAVYPPVVAPGKKTAVTVYGRNLPGGKPDPSAVLDGHVLDKLITTVEPTSEPAALQQLRTTGYVPPRSSFLDGFELRLRNEVGISNPYLLTYARAPVFLDNENNDTVETAQEVPVPCEIVGRVEKKGDRDCYRFTAKKGDVFTIEAFADRIGAPVLLSVTLRPMKDKNSLTEFGDNNDSLHPTLFYTRSDDPARQRFAAPADGEYLLKVISRDADLHADPRHLYHVRIAPEQPDYRLIVMPPSMNSPDAVVVRQDGRASFTVLVWRFDGFNGEVRLAVDGLPEGVTCPSQVIGPNQRFAGFVVNAAPNAPVWNGAITVKGTATINGAEVVREARPASIIWPIPPQQQNVALISRLDRNLVLAVREKALYALSAEVQEVTTVAGQNVSIPLRVNRHSSDFKSNVQVTLLNPSQQGAFTFNNNQPLNLAKDETNVTLNVRNTPPGTYTVAFRGQATAPVGKDIATKEKRPVAHVQPSSPITVTILPQAVATVSLAPDTIEFKPGGDATVTVKVIRQNGFKGAFKVKLILPAEAKGIEAGEVEIPEGKNEAKLTVKAADNAAAVDRVSLIVRVTAPVKEKVEMKQDLKLTAKVGKSIGLVD